MLPLTNFTFFLSSLLLSFFYRFLRAPYPYLVRVYDEEITMGRFPLQKYTSRKSKFCTKRYEATWRPGIGNNATLSIFQARTTQVWEKLGSSMYPPVDLRSSVDSFTYV